MGKCDVKGPQIEVSTSNRNKNENSARTTTETTTVQQRIKMNAAITESKSKSKNKHKHKNISKVKNIYTNDVNDYTNDELKIGTEKTRGVVPPEMYQKKYKRTRGKKKISRTKEEKQNRMLRRNTRKMRGMMEQEWASYEPELLKDLIHSRKEIKIEVDRDRGATVTNPVPQHNRVSQSR